MLKSFLNFLPFSPLLFGSGAVANPAPPTDSYGQTSGGIGTQISTNAPPGYAPFAKSSITLPPPPNAPPGYAPRATLSRPLSSQTVAPPAPASSSTPLQSVSPLASAQGEAPVLQTVVPSSNASSATTARPTLQTGVEGGAMGSLAPASEYNTVDAYGTPAPKIITRADQINQNIPLQDMQAAGYVYDVQGQRWVMSGSQSQSGNTWWSQKYGTNFRVGSGYVGQFRTEQAYNTWMRQKKNLAKKEDSGGMNKATQTANVNYGTG